MKTNEKMLIVGSLGTSHGVHGWMKITSFTDPDTNILNYNPWYFKSHGVYSPIKVLDTRIQGPYLIAQLEGCDSRETAKLWTGREISVPRSIFPPCSENEFYWTDLEGLQVLDEQGTALGHIDTLMATGSNDVLLISDKLNKKCLQIPFIMHEVVKKVDLAAGIVIVNWQDHDE